MTTTRFGEQGWRAVVMAGSQQLRCTPGHTERCTPQPHPACRRAYATLSQHVAALEQEARNMTADLARFETQAVPPQLVAQEVGGWGGCGAVCGWSTG